MTEFLNQEKPFPHCPGCGHPHVLRSLDEALKEFKYAKDRISLVTDIGCVGLSDAYFPKMHTVHTLHGRSSAVASGLQMGADATVEDPLKAIVLVGDGGAGIGLLHLIHAAQMNVDVTVLVHNNFIYGMTGGQHSLLTPEGLKTTTTPEGSVIPPLDLGALLMGAGSSFFARTIAPGNDLTEMIRKAVAHPGFACVEIFELCPTFATKKGGITGKTLKELPNAIHRELGILREDLGRESFRVLRGEKTEALEELPGGIEPNSSLSNFKGSFQTMIGGRAGERAQSAANLTAKAACAAGLYATVRSDNPVTQGSGFSLAELTISSDPIEFSGMPSPDLVLITAQESLPQIQMRGLLGPGEKTLVMVDQSLDVSNLEKIEKMDFRKKYGPKNAALGALIQELSRRDLWKEEAWHAVFSTMPENRRKDPLEVLSKSRLES